MAAYERRVNGGVVRVELKDSDFETGVDLDRETGRVAPLIRTVGELIGEYTRRRDVEDARYRQWRAARMKEELAKDPKIAEWKAKTEVESDAKFLAFKEAIAELDGQIESLRGAQDALKAKSYLVGDAVKLRVKELDGSRGGVGAGDDRSDREDARDDRPSSRRRVDDEGVNEDGEADRDGTAARVKAALKGRRQTKED